jgi:hypothetical protein
MSSKYKRIAKQTHTSRCQVEGENAQRIRKCIKLVIPISPLETPSKDDE